MSLNFFRKQTIPGVRIETDFDEYVGQVIGVTALGWYRVNLWNHYSEEWEVRNFQPQYVKEAIEIPVA